MAREEATELGRGQIMENQLRSLLLFKNLLFFSGLTVDNCKGLTCQASWRKAALKHKSDLV